MVVAKTLSAFVRGTGLKFAIESVGPEIRVFNFLRFVGWNYFIFSQMFDAGFRWRNEQSDKLLEDVSV